MTRHHNDCSKGINLPNRLQEFKTIEDEQDGNRSFLDKIMNYFNG